MGEVITDSTASVDSGSTSAVVSAPANTDPLVNAADHPLLAVAPVPKASDQPKEPGLLLGKEDPKAPEAPKAPENYEPFKFPEGVTLTDAENARIIDTAKALSLTQDQAQKFAERAIQAVAKAQTDSQMALEKRDNEWVEKVKADAEIGGAKFEESVAVANKAFKQFASDEVKNILTSTRLGNHPAVVKMFYTIGKALGEPGFQGGKGSPAPKPATSILFDKMENTTD